MCCVAGRRTRDGSDSRRAGRGPARRRDGLHRRMARPHRRGLAAARRFDGAGDRQRPHGCDDGMGSAAFVRRLQRADVDAEVVPAAGLAAAVLASDVVVVEALAAAETDLLAVAGSRAARIGGVLLRGSGVGRRRSRAMPAPGVVRGDGASAGRSARPVGRAGGNAADRAQPMGCRSAAEWCRPSMRHWQPNARCRTSCSAPVPCDAPGTVASWPASVRRSR